MLENVSFPLALSAGVLSFLSPCVLPLVPIYLGYLTGTSAGNSELSAAQSRRFTLLHGLAFVAGFSLVFMAWGALGGALYHIITHPVVIWIGAMLLVVMGLHMLGVVRIPILFMEKRMHVERTENPNVLSSMLIGATFAAGWTPCVGPVLGAIILLAAQQGSALQGALLLGVYSLGLAIPFLLMAGALGRATGFIRRLGPKLRYIEMASGVLLIVVAIMLVTGQMTQLSQFFYQLTPAWLSERL
ncbi:MAG: sulfite exporter TauE/SafE family protein [Anaerolineales bacterium]|nr:sulfite exporter TauE/SafE family protein [Anaerolineales bacterium]MCB9172455.1 sulfite exporter TauE/SafE family protein [Ardenticatenales bacterium]